MSETASNDATKAGETTPTRRITTSTAATHGYLSDVDHWEKDGMATRGAIKGRRGGRLMEESSSRRSWVPRTYLRQVWPRRHTKFGSWLVSFRTESREGSMTVRTTTKKDQRSLVILKARDLNRSRSLPRRRRSRFRRMIGSVRAAIEHGSE
jgi:hypothetical protein